MTIQTNNICFSGGATGADTVFGQCANAAGHCVVHYGFNGHRTKCLTYILTESQLKLADPFLKKANKTLHRSFPTRWENTNNLLRRNYYQIKDTERVYAVGAFLSMVGDIDGGTAWAIEMAKNKGVLEIYFFNEVNKEWYIWFPIVGGWEKMGFEPPYPHGLYTGIGTRRLTDDGKHAIEKLYSTGNV